MRTPTITRPARTRTVSAETSQGLTSRLLPAAVGVAIIGIGVASVALLGTTRAMAVAAVMALVLVAVAATALTAFAMVARRRLGELQYLPDLGRRFVTNHDDGRVTDVSETPGHLTIHLASDHVQTMVLDDSGAPDHFRPVAPESTSWRLSTAKLTPEQILRIKQGVKPGTDVSVVSSGVVSLTGPVQQSWKLTTADGLVLAAGRN